MTSLAGEFCFVAGQRAGDTDQAVAWLRTSRRLFPLDHWLRTGEADYYAQQRWRGSLRPAIAAHRMALDEDPWNAGLHRNLAALLLEAGEEREASQHIGMVHRITPHSLIQLLVNTNPDKR